MKTDISYQLPMTIFREGKSFVAYSPSLDLSSCGKTEAQAKRMFGQAVEMFFEELVELGTLESVMKDLGWTKTKGRLQPPRVVRHAVMGVQIPAIV